MTTDNTPTPPKKTLTLKLNANAPIPEKLQEKLKQIKETYLAPVPQKKPVPSLLSFTLKKIFYQSFPKV